MKGMRVRVYEIMRRAVEDGVVTGWRRAHKHTDKPNPDAVMDDIADAVMTAICEVFSFDQEEV